MSKLKHPPDDDWNQHRHDLSNLTRYVESRWKKDLTWQVVDMRLASVDDLLQSPVLFLCGSESPLPNDPAREEMVGKFRDYLDRGGFLFAEAYCGESGFDKGFRELMSRVFPEPEYRLRLLEPGASDLARRGDHFARAVAADLGNRVRLPHERGLRALTRPRIRGRRCRVFGSFRGGGGRLSKRPSKPDRRAMAMGINILAYATNRELKTKEEYFHAPTQRRPGDQVERGRLYIANLRHPAAATSRPGGRW